MGYSREHVEATRERILESASRLFRRHGYDGVGIDQIMEGADLTRGGFYAHFRSKEDLFVNVLRQELEFAAQLRRLAATRGDDPAQGAMEAVAYYLEPGNRRKIARGCLMVSNLPDVARASTRARRAFSRAFEDFAEEFETLLSEDLADEPERALAAIATCVGGVAIARSLVDVDRATTILEACKASVMRELGRS